MVDKTPAIVLFFIFCLFAFVHDLFIDRNFFCLFHQLGIKSNDFLWADDLAVFNTLKLNIYLHFVQITVNQNIILSMSDNSALKPLQDNLLIIEDFVFIKVIDVK